jgi:hypothetical protein
VSDPTRAVLVLTPPESKRIIAKAVARMPVVRGALQGGRLIVGHGTTNAYVAEELLGRSVGKWQYAAGIIAGGRLGVTDGGTRLPPIALKAGKEFEGGWTDLLREFEGGDVFIKGGNALDPDGNVGVLLGSDVGGTVGQMLGIVAARGAHLVVPIGLEKLVPDVIEAARHCGIAASSYADGLPVGMAVLSNAQVVSELEAFEMLCGVHAWHIASGGIGGSEGAVTLAVEGSEPDVREACQLAESVSGEPPLAEA